MVFSCFAVYALANNTRVVLYFYRRVCPRAINASKYRTTRVLFASAYTAKQLKTIYYSLNTTAFISTFHSSPKALDHIMYYCYL